MKKKRMVTNRSSVPDNKFERMHMRVMEFCSQLMEEGHEPLAVAAAITQIGYSIYKTTLEHDDYETLVKYIYEARSDIKPITPPVGTLQ